MRPTISLLLSSLLFTAAAFAQQGERRGGYAGEERRGIKSLSPAEVEGLLQGHGMGLAKAAELNHHPGPRHVLELAEQLKLSPDQRAATKIAFNRMRREAVRLGALIVAKESELDDGFARGEMEEGRLRKLTGEIAALQGRLRAAHLSAHLDMRRILTPGQIKQYDALRGYGADGSAGASPQHSKH